MLVLGTHIPSLYAIQTSRNPSTIYTSSDTYLRQIKDDDFEFLGGIIDYFVRSIPFQPSSAIPQWRRLAKGKRKTICDHNLLLCCPLNTIWNWSAGTATWPSRRGLSESLLWRVVRLYTFVSPPWEVAYSWHRHTHHHHATPPQEQSALALLQYIFLSYPDTEAEEIAV
jgi:hypothetical protein